MLWGKVCVLLQILTSFPREIYYWFVDMSSACWKRKRYRNQLTLMTALSSHFVLHCLFIIIKKIWPHFLLSCQIIYSFHSICIKHWRKTNNMYSHCKIPTQFVQTFFDFFFFFKCILYSWEELWPRINILANFSKG